MLKKDVVEGLKNSGLFNSHEIETHWLYTFKPLARAERAAALDALINPNASNGAVSKEKDMSSNTESTINTTFDFGYGMTAQIVAQQDPNSKYGICTDDSTMVVTCDNCKDGVINVGEASGATAQRAINAATDWFYYREFLSENNVHLEPGLRLNMSKEDFAALADDGYAYQEGGIGLVGKRYSGNYFLGVRQGAWGQININFGKFKVTRVRQSQDEILKQDFVDALLDGYTLNISLAKVKFSWLRVVVDNLSNPDKAEGFRNYWDRKAAAGSVAKAKRALYNAERRVARDHKNGEVTEETATIEEKMEYISVSINGTEPVVTAISDLPHGAYDVLNTRMNNVGKLMYNGTPSSTKLVRGRAVQGYVLSPRK